MAPAYTLTGPGIAADQVELGQLVTNIWTPAFPSHNPHFKSCSPQTHEDTRYESHLQYNDSAKSSISVKLSKLFGFGRKQNSSVKLKIEAESTATHVLLNYIDVIRTLRDDGMEETWEWIQNRLEDAEDIFMVVGIRTVTDAKVAVEESSGTLMSFNVSVPVTELASNGLSTPLGITALDVMIAMTAMKSGGMTETHTLPGTWVMAVQYCKVKIKKRLRREAKLVSGSTSWEWFTGRGMRSGEAAPYVEPQDRVVVDVDVGNMVDGAEVEKISGGEDDWEREEGDEDEDDDDDDRVETFAIDGIELVF